MKNIFFAVVISWLVLKSKGAVINSMEDEVIKFKNEMTQELIHMTKPVLTAAEILRNEVAQYKIKHTEVQLRAKTFMEIDPDACQELSDVLEEAGQLGWNATVDVYKMILNVTTTLADLTDCIGWNPIDTAKCYVNGISTVVNTIKSIKPTIVETFQQIWSMRKNLEPLFMKCIGNGPTTTPPTTLPTTTVTTTTTRPTTTTVTTTTTTRPTTTTAKSWWSSWGW